MNDQALVTYHESRGGCDAPEAGPSDTPEACIFRAQCYAESARNSYARYEGLVAETYAMLTDHLTQQIEKMKALASVRTQMEANLDKMLRAIDEAMKAIRGA